MILTNCAACAAPLAHDAPRCVRCHVRYCDATCQHDHWRRGHKQMCKKIHRGGNAEQYNADKKYKEAVAAAVEACADDTKGQTCYICTQALHWKTKEGLVRMCACRGTAGFAHVSCLAEQAKILMDEADEKNLSGPPWDEKWGRWKKCSLCKQNYHGVVSCALGWACWKTYCDQPQTAENERWRHTMEVLGQGLRDARRLEEAVAVQEALLATARRLSRHLDTSESVPILFMQANLAVSYNMLGRVEEALSVYRETYALSKRLLGPSHTNTLNGAFNIALALNKLHHFDEAKTMLREPISVARRAFGEQNIITIDLHSVLAEALLGIAMSGVGGIEDLRAGVAMCEDVYKRTRQILGALHPMTQRRQRRAEKLRAALAQAEATLNP